MDYDGPVSESITFLKLDEIKKELALVRNILQPVTYSRLAEEVEKETMEPQTRLLQEIQRILNQVRELRQDIKL